MFKMPSYEVSFLIQLKWLGREAADSRTEKCGNLVWQYHYSNTNRTPSLWFRAVRTCNWLWLGTIWFSIFLIGLLFNANNQDHELVLLWLYHPMTGHSTWSSIKQIIWSELGLLERSHEPHRLLIAQLLVNDVGIECAWLELNGTWHWMLCSNHLSGHGTTTSNLVYTLREES